MESKRLVSGAIAKLCKRRLKAGEIAPGHRRAGPRYTKSHRTSPALYILWEPIPKRLVRDSYHACVRASTVTLKQPRLPAGKIAPEVFVGALRSHTSARCAVDHSD